MDKIFKEFHEFCIVYVNDIIIFLNNEVNHINHLVSFAEKWKKVEIMKPRIGFLGLIIDETEIEMQSHIFFKNILFSE